MTKEQTIKELTVIPGIGKSLATDLWNIGITSIDDLKGKDPRSPLYLIQRLCWSGARPLCIVRFQMCGLFCTDATRASGKRKTELVVLERLIKQLSYSAKYDDIF